MLNPFLQHGVRLLLAIALTSAVARGDDTVSPDERDFFESRIRPTLAEHCYECHNSTDLAEGGLALDHRKALQAGGDSGPAIELGKPEESLLIKMMRHEIGGSEMPQGGAKLDPEVVSDFERWIAIGAPDPRDAPPSAAELAQATSWEAVFAKRKQWWSLQPLRRPPLPELEDGSWSAHPIDRFVLARLESAGLEPTADADRRTLISRLSFALTGLPPTPAATQRFLDDADPLAYERLVDRLLASSHFGERWARHWMDWIRYAESHGSEGDPEIAEAWRYRDYLIRALNADVPYDQLVREHVAGDLLENPRTNDQLGISESLIATAHWRMVFHGFAPTDALEEKVRFTDDQLNVFSKAFLGLTVSCARCHDHKFDAISQSDYYALFGILASTRPGRAAIELPAIQDTNREQLSALKSQIRSHVADQWLAAVADLRMDIAGDGEDDGDHVSVPSVLSTWLGSDSAPREGEDFTQAWQQRASEWQSSRQRWQAHLDRDAGQRWDLTDRETLNQWFHYGNGLPEQPAEAGDFVVATEGPQAIAGIYPAGVYSHLLSSKHAGVLTSPDVFLDGPYELWLRIAGGGRAMARYVVQNFPRDGSVYPVTQLTDQQDLASPWRWQKYNISYWEGDNVHVELMTADDAPVLVKNSPRSWFGIREAALVPKGDAGPPSDMEEHLVPLFEAAEHQPPESLEALCELFVDSLTAAIAAWKDGSMSDAQAVLLDRSLAAGILPNQLDQLPEAGRLIAEYRRLEADVPVLTRVPTVLEWEGRNQPLLQRGDHHLPGDEVPRRFLSAIDPAPYETHLSGRRQLAEDLLREDNPLTRRVLVNRLWHHLFGRGIVATPDNFGALGQPPTHPELLDYLATRFADDGWSLKDAIRLVVTSRTWRLAVRPPRDATEVDPDNRLLSHARVRRLEAEAIRDAILAVSGELDAASFGPPVAGTSRRRSIYVQVQRNSLDPLLRVFDFPEPFSTSGRRDVTNVPAQALTMMNDPYIAECASAWAKRITEDATLASDAQRIERMFAIGLGRPATTQETEQIRGYLAEMHRQYADQAERREELRRQTEQGREAIEQMLTPVQTALLAEDAGTDAPSAGPPPIARWNFDRDLRDQIGASHGVPHGNAVIKEGALVLDGQSYVESAPLSHPLREKTLAAWVMLGNLDQQGGGAVSVQSTDGSQFDAIVFGENHLRQWLPGSDLFARTQPFGGELEREAIERPVHVAISYHADGRIVGYRDGIPYGNAYRSPGPVEFPPDETIVTFGLRHLPAGGNRFLTGRILQAQIWDRALSAAEVQTAAEESPPFVSETQVLQALTAEQRAVLEHKRQELAAWEDELHALGALPEQPAAQLPWRDLARAIFSFKEFIYVK